MSFQYTIKFKQVKVGEAIYFLMIILIALYALSFWKH
jgi:hypothetical protein